MKDDSRKGVAIPGAVLAQQEAGAMFSAVLEQMLRMLRASRPMGRSGEKDSYMQIDEGWPEVLRGMAIDAAEILNSAANECEQNEASFRQYAAG